MIGSIDEFVQYQKQRGVVITPEKAGPLLQKATDYINLQEWIGAPVDEDQEDEWPRILPGDDGRLVDESGNQVFDDLDVVTGVTPRKVVLATYRLAAVAARIDLLPSFSGPAVVERRIEGAIDVKYSEATLNSAPVFDWFEPMVGRWLHDSGHVFQFPVRRG